MIRQSGENGAPEKGDWQVASKRWDLGELAGIGMSARSDLRSGNCCGDKSKVRAGKAHFANFLSRLRCDFISRVYSIWNCLIFHPQTLFLFGLPLIS